MVHVLPQRRKRAASAWIHASRAWSLRLCALYRKIMYTVIRTRQMLFTGLEIPLPFLGQPLVALGRVKSMLRCA